MLGAILFLAAPSAMAIEEPAFTTLAEEQGFSVREYAPRVVAETAVEGTLGTASSGGFRRLAG